MKANLPDLKDLVGHEDIRRTIIENIIVCLSTNNPIPNILAAGNSGCGKTTLAKAVAKIIKADFYEFLARTIEPDMSEFVLELYEQQSDNKKVLIFIDEVHQLSSKNQELLYPLLDSDNISFFCATTDTGKLLRPFQNRFKLFFNITSYSTEDAVKIVEKYTKRMNYKITSNAKLTIAMRSRGVPRTIENNTDGCWNKASFLYICGESKKKIITEKCALEYFSDQGIDNKGLTKQERLILRTLIDNGGTLNLTTVACICQIDINQFTEIYEPYLTLLGFINKDSRGRSITGKGIDHVVNSGFNS